MCLFRSAEITEAIFFALHSASHGLENFSGFTGFLTQPTAKIWRDFRTSSPSLILRKLYIFCKLKNVQSIVDKRNWTRVNYFQTTCPWWRRRRHWSWASRILVIPTTGASAFRQVYSRYHAFLKIVIFFFRFGFRSPKTPRRIGRKKLIVSLDFVWKTSFF